MFGDNKDSGISISETPGFTTAPGRLPVSEAPASPPPVTESITPGIVPGIGLQEIPELKTVEEPTVLGINSVPEPVFGEEKPISSMTDTTMEFRSGPFDEKPQETVIAPAVPVMAKETDTAPVEGKALPVNVAEFTETMNRLAEGMMEQNRQLSEIHDLLKNAIQGATADQEPVIGGVTESPAVTTSAVTPKAEEQDDLIEGYKIGATSDEPSTPGGKVI